MEKNNVTFYTIARRHLGMKCKTGTPVVILNVKNTHKRLYLICKNVCVDKIARYSLNYGISPFLKIQ